jgi:LysR family transcriptional regulator for bpeEF and oprC
MDRDLFRGLVPFVAVVDAGGFRAAGARLGVTAAAISKSVGELEARLGVVLLLRGTRTVTPTPEGHALAARAREAIAAIGGARDALESTKHAPSGELSVSAPHVAAGLVAPALALLRHRHPRLSFRLTITDRLSRIEEESIDIAVRIGPITHASLVARRLRRTRLLTVAAPSYLGRRGVPRRLDELASHDCLVLTGGGGRPRPWEFRTSRREVPIAMLTDHGPSLLDAALVGLGITQLFDHMAEPHLRAGALVELFEPECADGPDVHAVCAPGRRAAPRVRAAFAAFADAFARGAVHPLG